MTVASKLGEFRRSCFRRLLRSASLAAIAAASLGSVDLSSTLAQEQLPSQWNLTNTNVSIQMDAQRQTVEMVVNTSREITADQVFQRVRIQNPNVLKVRPLEGGNRLEVSAITTGVTQLDLLGEDDSVHTIQIMVLGDVRELEAILRQQFPDANLSVTPVQQGCIVNGYVTSDEHVELIMQIAELYFPTVINKVTVTGVHTIQLETQIMEVSRTKLRNLGVDWAFANGDDAISSSVGGILQATGTAFNATGNETMAVGVVQNSSTFFSAIRALRQNNLVKVLASPTLTAVDGRPASFNSGGEIPIVVPAGLGQVGIQFREFGTRLDYVAKVRGGGRIWLEVRPYVSEIDESRSVTILGTEVPGLRSRFLETGVEMGAGQTLALGGLLQLRTEAVDVGIPGLSDMPYLGVLFRSVRETQNEVELLITVTPNFAGPMNPHEVPMMGPGMATESPTDRDLYMRGYLETPVTQNGHMGYPGMIESMPSGQAYPIAAPQDGYIMGSSAYPTNTQPMPVPNPAAMSIGPNAPKLAQQPRMLPPPSLMQQPSAYGQAENSGPGVIR